MIGSETEATIFRRPREIILTGIITLADVMGNQSILIAICLVLLAVSALVVMIVVKTVVLCMQGVTEEVIAVIGGLDHGVLAVRTPPTLIPLAAIRHLLALHEAGALFTLQARVSVDPLVELV